ncbi:hypothetical protein KSF78_0003957 [Schistosoma japonicum]|nr:hypothetical protein KSF78_0003957 [Schistosoma japonicum]KAH8868311.1 hypothetical protein KSF78_0003957 [Schistosoma japonicum]
MHIIPNFPINLLLSIHLFSKLHLYANTTSISIIW